MALLFWNKNTLNDQAIIYFDYSDDNIKVEENEEYTLIKSQNKLIGINIKDASKLLKVKEGAQSLTKEMIDVLTKKLKIDLSEVNTSSKFIVGEIIKREAHPKSDRLFLLTVQTDKELKIVTNTTNSTESKFIVVAQLGAILPSGTIIKPAKVMGVESQGMLCGKETLNLGKGEGAHLLKDVKAGQIFTL